MGGRPSKGTPADRRLKANQPTSGAKKAAAKAMVPAPKPPPMRGRGKRA